IGPEASPPASASAPPSGRSPLEPDDPLEPDEPLDPDDPVDPLEPRDPLEPEPLPWPEPREPADPLEVAGSVGSWVMLGGGLEPPQPAQALSKRIPVRGAVKANTYFIGHLLLSPPRRVCTAAMPQPGAR